MHTHMLILLHHAYTLKKSSSDVHTHKDLSVFPNEQLTNYNNLQVPGHLLGISEVIRVCQGDQLSLWWKKTGNR